MKNKKSIILILFFIAITMLFFSYGVVITFDSSHYLWLTSLLTPEGNISNWDIARGPVFPMIIRTFNILFGQSTKGVLAGMFIFYLLMLLGCYLIYRDTIKNEEFISNKMKAFLAVAFIFLIAINPMIIGYYHTLLTEFVAITLGIIGCYLAWKWIGINFKENKGKYIVYTVILSVLTAVSWLLKQPYVSTILFPTVVAALVSFIRNTSWKNFLQRFISLVSCVIVLAVSLKGWNIILKNNDVNMREDRSSSGFFANGIVSGLEGYDAREGTISTEDAIKFWISEFKKSPIIIAQKYITNYLATISIYSIDFDVMKIIIDKKIDFTHTAEIGIIGFRIFEYGNECVFSLSEKYSMYAEPYKEINKPIVASNFIMRKLILPDTIAMKLSYLALPIMVIISIVFVFRTKKRYNQKYGRIIDMITILFTYSFLNILAYSLLGSTIDRYTMPSLVTTYIGILLSIYAILYRKNYKKEEIKMLEKEKIEK